MAAAAAARAAMPVIPDCDVIGADTGTGEASRGVVFTSWAAEVFAAVSRQDEKTFFEEYEKNSSKGRQV